MYEHLLVPVDDSELAERAMAASVELARRLGARITGFIAEPFVAPPLRSGLGQGASVTQRDHVVQHHAQGVLLRFERRCAAASVPFTPCTTQAAHIDEAILDAAREQGCDMIVLVARSRSTLGEVMWGSYTKNLLARCTLPLLMLH